MGRITDMLRRLLLTATAFGVGLISGGVLSYLLVRLVVLALGPIFWEGGEGFLPLFAALFGGVNGMICEAACCQPWLAGKTRKARALAGLCLGSLLCGLVGLWVVSGGSFTDARAPRGITFWTLVILVATGALTGMIGGLIADFAEASPRYETSGDESP